MPDDGAGIQLTVLGPTDSPIDTGDDARLNDWIILKGLRAIKPAPQSDGDQRVQGNLQQLNRN